MSKLEGTLPLNSETVPDSGDTVRPRASNGKLDGSTMLEFRGEEVVSSQGTSLKADEIASAERERLEPLRGAFRDKTLEYERASAKLTKARRKAEALSRREQALSNRLEVLATEFDEVKRAREDLGRWIGQRQKSYGWRLITVLRAERATLQGDADALGRKLNAPLSVQSAVLNSMRTSFSRRIVSRLLIVVLLVFAVFYLSASYPALGAWQHWLNVFSWPIWVVLLVGLAIYLLIIILALLAYHRQWSAYWSILRSERARTAVYRDAVGQLRQEQQRLKGMHEQVPTYLRLMSEVIHRPWTMTAAYSAEGDAGGGLDSRVEAAISSTWGVFPRPNPSSIPSLMRLAQTPPKGGGAECNELIRRSVVRILHRGWRDDAYKELLREAEKIRGIPPGSFTPERLDREPRVRESFLLALEDGQAQVAAGMTHLRALYPKIQTDLMNQVHPRVQRLDPDPLEGLDLSVDLLNGVDEGEIGWDELLGSILGAPADWSPTAFTLAGKSDKPEVLARGYGPVRFAAEGVHESITYASQKPLLASSLEMTVRIDTLPVRVSPSHLQAFTVPVLERPDLVAPGLEEELDGTHY